MVGKEKVDIGEGMNAYELAKKMSLTGPDQAISVRVNGQLHDLDPG